MRSTLTMAFSREAAYLANRKTSCMTVMAEVRLRPAMLAPIALRLTTVPRLRIPMKIEVRSWSRRNSQQSDTISM